MQEKVAKEVEQRVSSKSSDLLLRDLFSTTMHEILVWTPFPNDRLEIFFFMCFIVLYKLIYFFFSFDWEVGECECPTFKKKMKTLSFTCVRAERIFEDVLGRMWTEKFCSHEWFVLWIQLYSEIIEKLPR